MFHYNILHFLLFHIFSQMSSALERGNLRRDQSLQETASHLGLEECWGGMGKILQVRQAIMRNPERAPSGDLIPN